MIVGFSPSNQNLQDLSIRTTLSGPDNNTASNPSVIARSGRQSIASGIANDFAQDLMSQNYNSKPGLGIMVDVKV